MLNLVTDLCKVTCYDQVVFCFGLLSLVLFLTLLFVRPDGLRPAVHMCVYVGFCICAQFNQLTLVSFIGLVVL